jgi:predicted metal-dependent hydrolase
MRLFNAGQYWEAHEAWEKIWQRHREPWRYFIQGLIQAAAAHHQLRRGIKHGVIKHLRNALAKLDAAPAEFAGLAIDRFREYLHRLLVQSESSNSVIGLMDLASKDKSGLALGPILWVSQN